MEETYRQFERMIHSRAKKVARDYPSISEEELVCEANYAFIKAVENHNESLGSLSTCLHWTLWSALTDYARKHSKERGREAGKLVMEPEDCSRESEDILQKFGADAREVVSIALTSPEDLTRGLLREILKDMGWGVWRIRLAFAEIRNVL